MFKVIKNLLKLLLILLAFNSIKCRDLTVDVNPDCNSTKLNCNEFNLIHIQSKGDKDIIHYLWSSIRCIPPTLIIAETEPNSKLAINWTKLVNNYCSDNTSVVKNAISLNKVKNSIGFQFSRLYFFNDIKGKGSFVESDPIIEIQWKNFIWKEYTKPNDIKDSIVLNFSNNVTSDELYNSSVSFKLRIDSSDGRNDELPHLSFTQKSVSLEFSVQNFETDSIFNDTNKPRFKADIFVMTDAIQSKSVPDFDRITSIDDEYTPGVFSRYVLNVNSKSEQKNEKNSFLAWKPIAYNNKERIIANTLDVIQGRVNPINESQLTQYNSRILNAFFGNESSKYSFDLTFGASDDEKYYNDNPYNTFALVVGVDKAPEEGLSFLVKMIIFVGFGLPLLVMVVSALYLIVRKIRKRKFNDLLLSQSQTLE